MSISSATRKAGPFFCNGSTDTFPFAYKVFTSADVRVVLTDPIGAESDLVLGTHYTVSLNADQDANPGGSVVTTTAYPGGYRITLTSKLQNLQPVTLTNAGGFYPKVLNDAFDRTTILIQQLAEQVARSVKVQISSSITPDALISQLETDVSNAAAAASAAAAKLTEFKGVYYGPYSSDPATDPNGNAPNAGDMYYNTTSGALCVYHGTGWTVLNGVTAATETASGIVELATAAEAQALASAVVALTPARLADAFKGANQSLGISGYQKLPGGLIVQWGTSSFPTNGDSSLPVTFPIAFPSAILMQGWCPVTTALSAVIGAYINNPTTTGMTLIADKGTAESVTVGGAWWAIGY